MTDAEVIAAIRRRMAGFAGEMAVPPAATASQIAVAFKSFLMEVLRADGNVTEAAVAAELVGAIKTGMANAVDPVIPASLGVMVEALLAYDAITPPVTDRAFALGFAEPLKVAMAASADDDTVPDGAVDDFIAALEAAPELTSPRKRK